MKALGYEVRKLHRCSFSFINVEGMKPGEYRKLKPFEVKKGDRICQFRIMECQPKIFFYETTLEGKDRGGFGSTGTK